MILVTGGTGLIGSHLLFELTKHGKKVRALKRSTSDIGLINRLFNAFGDANQQQYNSIEWVEGDVEDYQSIVDALESIEEVYHCAAMVSFDKRMQSRMLEVNVQGTANMVDASLDAGVKKFCHVSSVASLGSPAEGQMVDEETPWGKSKGKSAYSVSKFRSEMEVWRAIERGLNAVIVNPSVVIGPGKWDTGSGLILGTIAKGFPFYTLGVTGYVDVRDVVSAMITSMEMEMWGKRYLLNGENSTHKNVFTLIATAMGKKPPRIRVYPWMSSLAWPLASVVGFFTRKAPVLTRDTARSGHKKTYYSADLATKELGIKFHSVAQAIENAVKGGPL